MRRAIIRGMSPLAFLLTPSVAFAHPMKGVGDFYAGMLHPVTTVETVVPLIALSLLAGQQHRDVAIKILFAIPVAIVFGTLLTFFSPAPAPLGVGNLVITAVAGLMIAVAKPLPSVVPISMSVLFGIALGWANAAEIAQGISPVRFISGLAVVGVLLTAYGIGLVRGLRFEWSQIAVRVVGSWLAAIGILVLGLR